MRRISLFLLWLPTAFRPNREGRGGGTFHDRLETMPLQSMSEAAVPPAVAPVVLMPTVASRIYSGESPLSSPRTFLRQALRDLLDSRGAAVRLFQQSIAQKYRHSVLGLFWAFAPAALTAVILTVGKRGDVRDSLVSPQLYAVFGLIMAQTFLESLTTQRMLFPTHRFLLNRHRAPVEGLILAGIMENLFGIAMKVALLAVVFLFFRTPPSVTLPLGLMAFFAIFLIGTTLGLLMAPWNALQKDLDNIMGIFPWAFVGLTPIFVQPQPGSELREVYQWNPFTHLFDATRFFVYGYGHQAAGSGLEHLTALFIAFGLCLFLLPIAWVLVRIARPYVVESFLM